MSKNKPVKINVQQCLTEIRYTLIKKATVNTKFRALLLSGKFDSQELLAKECGIHVSHKVKIHVAEETGDRVFVTIPHEMSTQKLSIHEVTDPYIQLVAKAGKDREFLNVLKNETKYAIEKELDVILPENLEVVVLQDQEHEFNLVLPPESGYFGKGGAYSDVQALKKVKWKGGGGGGCKPKLCSRGCFQGTAFSKCSGNTSCPGASCIPSPGDTNPTVPITCTPTDLCTAYGSNRF